MSGNLWRIGPRSGGLHQSTTQCDSDGCTRVAVINPEDAEQVERLAGLLAQHGAHRGRVDAHREARGIERALREYATPTQPRPAEPTGLGAVVEDADGCDWHRTATGRWIREDGLRCTASGWTHVNAVRVVSEGVVS